MYGPFLKEESVHTYNLPYLTVAPTIKNKKPHPELHPNLRTIQNGLYTHF